MSNSQNHIIQRQVLEVDLPESESHWEWQKRLSHFAREQFAPKLEALLDRLSLPGEVISIEKLELSADTISGENWEELLLEDLLLKAGEAFSRSIDYTSNPPGTTRISVADNRMEHFLSFLRTGVLSWKAPARLRQNFETEIMRFFEEADANRWTTLLKEILKTETARQRLVKQFSKAFLEKLVKTYFSESSGLIFESYRAILDFSEKNKLPAMEEIFWTKAFGLASGRLEEQSIFQETIIGFLNKNPGYIPQLMALQEAGKISLPLASARFLYQRPKLFKIFLLWQKNSRNGLEELGRFLKSGGEPAADELEKLRPATFERWLEQNLSPQPKPSPDPLPAGTDSLYIANAGMVLLHPFLPAFFEELAVVKQGQMVNPSRAIHLLQYLATGQENSNEFELPLNKLLCGFSPAEPVDMNFYLTRKEKSEAEKLLRAVIGHWQVLKNTTPGGLQGTYLCREGKLSRRSSGDWQLQVEQKAYDILLADLPWSISAVRFPWMEDMLWVDWQ